MGPSGDEGGELEHPPFRGQMSNLCTRRSDYTERLWEDEKKMTGESETQE